jgi:two-component system chemotaxis response regulator CheB
MDDGTSGMSAIKRCGGTCIVQNLDEAEFPDMPSSVINNLEVDYIENLSQMGNLISEIIQLSNGHKLPVPEDIRAESRIAEHTAVGINDVRDLGGDQSVYACPDCGGGLWDIKDDVVKRYRCHIGHAYTLRDLVVKQTETAGNTLWVALRMMEERKHMLRNLEVENLSRGNNQWAAFQFEKQEELDAHISKLKEIINHLQNADTA